MLRYFAGASLLALSTTAVFAQDESVTKYRVFVGDHDAARITAFDLGAPENRWTFETAGQAKLYPLDGGAMIAAVQSDDDRVDFLSSGIALHSHGDHSDIEITAPAALQGALEGPRPFHLIEHEGIVSINFDKGGYAMALDEHRIGEAAPKRIAQNVAHHGVVVPWGAGWLTSVAADTPDEEGKAPPRIGLRALDEAGAPMGEMQTCTNLHGEAFSGAYLAVGCKEGVLTATRGKDGTRFNMLPYPAEFPEGEMTGHFIGAKAMQIFLGSYGAKAMVVIDPADAPHMTLVELPFRRVDYALDPADPTKGYVLTEDGALNRIDMLSGRIDGRVNVTRAYSMDGHWNDPRPRLALAGEEILVTDPAAGLIRRIDSTDLTEIGTIAIEGIPYNITVAGGSGMAH